MVWERDHSSVDDFLQPEPDLQGGWGEISEQQKEQLVILCTRQISLYFSFILPSFKFHQSKAHNESIHFV